MYRAIIIALLLFQVWSYAQQPLDSRQVNTLTWKYYVNSQNDSLILLSEKAIKQGIDFYFLRLRLATAFFKQGKYANAIIHFEKALQFNATSEPALEYLYYSYLKMDRESDAKVLSLKFSPEMTARIQPIKNKLIGLIYGETGYVFSNHNTQNGKIDIDGSANIYGEYDRGNNVIYNHIGLKHEFTNRLSVYHGYSNVNTSFTRQLRYDDKDNVSDYTVNNHEYYIRGNIAFQQAWSVNLMMHTFNISYSYLNATYNDQKKDYDFNIVAINQKNRLFGISVSKSYGKISLSGALSSSDFSKRSQTQLTGNVNWFPLGNLKLYTTTGFSVVNDNNQSNFIFSQSVGVKIVSKINLEGGITTGNMKNYQERNGFIAYNIPDGLKFRGHLTLYYFINQQLNIDFVYQYFAREGNYIRFNTVNTFETVLTDYTNQSIIVNLKYKL